MASIDLIRASNGSGDAVKATVANARVISSTTIQVDATTNWPSKFIATVGSVDGTGAFVPATVTVFNGILSGGNIEITSFAPGYTDLGNTPGQIVVLKPTTAWANEMANTLAVSHNDNGTMKANSVTTAAITDANVTTAKIADGAVTAGKIDFATLKPAPVQTTATFSTASTTPTLITGMTITHTIPDGAVAMIVLSAPYVNSSQANAYAELGIWVGNVGTGTRIAGTSHRSYMAGGLSSQTAIGFITGDGTSKTFNASLNAAGGGTASVSVVNANTPISLAIVY